MKFILIAALSCIGMVAHANDKCASNISEAYKFQSLSAKVDVFGTWKGTNNGQPFVALFEQTPQGNFSGTLTMGSKKIGPTGVQICDYGGNSYSVVVYFQEAPLKVVSSKKVELTLPFSGNPKVLITKQ